MSRLALLGLLLAPLCAVGQEPALSADTVTLTFDWPIGMSPRVDLERTRIRSQGGLSADSSRMRVEYDMAVEDDGNGRLIRYSNFSAPSLVGVSDSEQQLLQLVSSVAPSYVVSPDGELLVVHELDSIRATIGTWLDQMFDSLPGVEMRALMDQMLSEDVLFALASQEWNALVGTWVDAEFEVGAAYELEAAEPMPMLGNVMVLYRYELGAYARVPCQPAGEALDCVELIIRSYPDPVELKPHLEAFVQRMIDAAGGGPEVPSLSYKGFVIENEVVLVAEPVGLIPHSLTISRATDVVMDVGGVEQVGSDYQLAEYRFTHR